MRTTDGEKSQEIDFHEKFLKNPYPVTSYDLQLAWLVD